MLPGKHHLACYKLSHRNLNHILTLGDNSNAGLTHPNHNPTNQSRHRGRNTHCTCIHSQCLGQDVFCLAIWHARLEHTLQSEVKARKLCNTECGVAVKFGIDKWALNCAEIVILEMPCGPRSSLWKRQAGGSGAHVPAAGVGPSLPSRGHQSLWLLLCCYPLHSSLCCHEVPAMTVEYDAAAAWGGALCITSRFGHVAEAPSCALGNGHLTLHQTGHFGVHQVRWSSLAALGILGWVICLCLTRTVLV